MNYKNILYVEGACKKINVLYYILWIVIGGRKIFYLKYIFKICICVIKIWSDIKNIILEFFF